MNEREAMARAIALGWQGWGRVGRNPMVGAVLLARGRLVAEAHHAEYGGAHAERRVLQSAGRRARGATLVVSLEPCRHHGKTPPCAGAIVEAGVRRVVFGASDVDPDARGGARVLGAAGVAVEGGLLESEVRAQNAAFFHRHAGTGRPFVALKLAQSLDGRIADHAGRSRWVGGPEARGWVHRLRAGFEAVAVGLGTARADDPQLTVRGDLVPSAPPLRVVFDRHVELSPASALARTARAFPTVVLASARGGNTAELESAGVEVVAGAGLRGALEALAARGVASLLVEGGATLAGGLLAEGLVDRIYLVTAPILLGDGARRWVAGMPDVALREARRWRVVGRSALGDDTLLVMDRP